MDASYSLKNDVLLTSAAITDDQERENPLLQYLQANKNSPEGIVAHPFSSKHYSLPYEELEDTSPIGSRKTSCDDDNHTNEKVQGVMLSILRAERECIRAIRRREEVTHDTIQHRMRHMDNTVQASVLCDIIMRRIVHDKEFIKKMTTLKNARCLLKRLCERKCTGV
uniref:Uncharacterized protein n=1 Tax=Penaeus semisulcatus majanivirus TaxID=2984274 RepID=A0A9C7F6N4_9VIRU|nr:MAG: hypothetical protein [Penaeus semisulcatus majanivirus]